MDKIELIKEVVDKIEEGDELFLQSLELLLKMSEKDENKNPYVPNPFKGNRKENKEETPDGQFVKIWWMNN